MRLSRRALAAAAGLLLPLPAAAAPAGPLVALLAPLRRHAATAALGDAWLRRHPGEASPAALEALILGALGTAHPPPGAFAAQVCREHGTGDHVRLDGWLLARSEARLLALATLTA